ncbi:MAG: T9SS type A sorting domain-containing protein [Bacteroidetes bacterium]|jgi:hypothetical protein|nr:T9SS type A sorting domain-containing protein [Bacteroidota bacterium]
MKDNDILKIPCYLIEWGTKILALLIITLSAQPLLFGQCELLDLPGVPVDLDLQESYVKTTEQKVVFPSMGTEATFSAYEYARMEPTVLIEEVQHAITSENEQVMISAVSNPSEYFNDYVVPYSHVIVEPSDIYIYQNESIIGSYSRSQWSLDSVDLEEGPSDPPVEGENTPYPTTALGGDLIQTDYGDLIYVIDTVQNFEIFNALDSNGQTKSVKFIQRDPNDTLRSVPLFSTHYYKQAKRNGDCFYQVIDKKYSHYCRSESNDSSSVDFRSTEVDDNSVSRNLMIYPNPANNFISLNYQSLEDRYLDGARLEVISQAGQIIDQRKVHPSKVMRMNISGYQSGIYIVRILSENNTLVNKFVKQ